MRTEAVNGFPFLERKSLYGPRVSPRIKRTDGKTELINGFISKKKRPFDAYLLLDEKGKLGFEFPPRKKRARKKQA